MTVIVHPEPTQMSHHLIEMPKVQSNSLFELQNDLLTSSLNLWVEESNLRNSYLI